MEVKILEKSSGKLRNGLILEAKATELPTIHDGWVFNFPNRLKESPNAKAYKLVLEGELEILLGCLIFQMVGGIRPYIAYLECSPENKGKSKKFEWIAGCLIAFSFKQSLIRGKGDYLGYLELDVQEKQDIDTIKLMSNYSNKYGFRRFGQTTTMCLADEDGFNLIREYLER
jgi:hypothetical protein